MHRILIADPLHPAALRVFSEAGVEFHELTGEERPHLQEVVADYDALVVRSSTRVDAGVLRAGRRLKVVGRAGIGVDNVDVGAATEMGVLVINAPTANLLSAIEHTFALLLSLARNVARADASLKTGVWDRKSFVGVELQGKTLGIVGFGRIGQRVAARAAAFEMKVVAYDPFLDPAVAERLEVGLLSLDDLLAASDIVTLHTPLTEQTRNLIDRDRLRALRPGALLVNCGRGGVVDEAALLEVLNDGHLGGAALDVFAEEPPTDFTLMRHPRVVATPHIGAQTREAQERVAGDTARMVLAALDGSMTVTAVNLPFRSAGGRAEPYLKLGEQLGSLASGLIGGSVRRLQVDLWGIDEPLRVPVTVAALKGALTPFLGEGVNYVNAERVAESRGIEVVRSTHHHGGEYPQLLEVTLEGDGGRRIEIGGTLFAQRDPRVVRFEGYRLEFRPAGMLLVLTNDDVPGVVGRVGTLLGEAGVNIAEIHLAREGDRADAMAVLRLDQEPSAELLAALDSLPEVRSTRVVDLG